MFKKVADASVKKGQEWLSARVQCGFAAVQEGRRGELSNPQKITCIIFENVFGPYFLPHQSHNYGYAPSSGENLTSKIKFKSDATYYYHIT